MRVLRGRWYCIGTPEARICALTHFDPEPSIGAGPGAVGRSWGHLGGQGGGSRSSPGRVPGPSGQWDPHVDVSDVGRIPRRNLHKLHPIKAGAPPGGPACRINTPTGGGPRHSRRRRRVEHCVQVGHPAPSSRSRHTGQRWRRRSWRSGQFVHFLILGRARHAPSSAGCRACRVGCHS